MFIPKYDKTTKIPLGMCMRTWPVPFLRIISKWMRGFCFFLTNNLDRYQLMDAQKSHITILIHVYNIHESDTYASINITIFYQTQSL